VHFAIVGAGPAGAALAYLLARAGGRVTLLERQTDFAREFRGEVLMPSGLDALAQMGLGAALDALPQSRISRGALYRGAELLVELPFGDTGPRVVSQPALLEMLVRESARWPGFVLERGFTVRDLISRDGAVAGVRGLQIGWVIDKGTFGELRRRGVAE
jgi:2-polyprenyl-6-methoxyphenol hydroxylase-like FAD-dependent oxidoreductase